MKQIVLTSYNPSKALQIQTFFKGSNIQIVTQGEKGVIGEAVEDGDSLEDNARKKIAFARAQLPDAILMADDTGLFIPACNGDPGIQAAYWGGEHLSVLERMQYCLSRLEGANDRRATFRTVIILSFPSGEEQVFVGEVQGTMLEKPRVSPEPKMPYSALFVPEESKLSWAEMTTEEENTRSHRGKALRQVKDFFEGVGH